MESDHKLKIQIFIAWDFLLHLLIAGLGTIGVQLSARLFVHPSICHNSMSKVELKCVIAVSVKPCSYGSSLIRVCTDLETLLNVKATVYT